MPLQPFAVPLHLFQCPLIVAARHKVASCFSLQVRIAQGEDALVVVGAAAAEPHSAAAAGSATLLAAAAWVLQSSSSACD